MNAFGERGYTSFIRTLVFFVSLTGVIICAVLSGLAGSRGEAQSAAAIRFVGNAHWIPYQFLDDYDKPEGFSVQLAETLCKQLGRPIEVVLFNGWDEAQRAVTEGRADAILGFEETDWRRADFDFSEPILKLKSVIAVSGKERGIHSLRDLYGTSIAVAIGSPVYLELSQDARFNIIPVADELKGLERLSAREAKALVGDELSIRYATCQRRIERIKIVGRPLLESDYVIGVKKGNSELLSEIESGLAELEWRGAIDKLITQWFGAEIAVQSLPPWVKWAAWVGVAIIVLVGAGFVLMLVFNEKLQQQVRERTLPLEQANRELNRGIEGMLRQWSLLIKGTFDAVIVTDLEHRIIEWNPAAEALYGYTREEALGKSAEMLNRTGDGPKLTRAILEGIAKDRKWTGKILFVRKDGSEGVTETVVLPVYDGDGNRVGTIRFDRDITARCSLSEPCVKARSAKRGFSTRPRFLCEGRTSLP